jgi:hypothetical protein
MKPSWSRPSHLRAGRTTGRSRSTSTSDPSWLSNALRPH